MYNYRIKIRIWLQFVLFHQCLSQKTTKKLSWTFCQRIMGLIQVQNRNPHFNYTILTQLNRFLRRGKLPVRSDVSLRSLNGFLFAAKLSSKTGFSLKKNNERFYLGFCIFFWGLSFANGFCYFCIKKAVKLWRFIWVTVLLSGHLSCSSNIFFLHMLKY